MRLACLFLAAFASAVYGAVWPTGSPGYACGHGYNSYKFCDTSLSIDERVQDLVQRIPFDQMPTILTAREPANLSSLGVPPFYWGTNCIQSVEAGAHNESAGARCTATSCPTHFANPPNWAASFNRTLIRAIGQAMGLELRAAYNSGLAKGLSCWGPVININRDPRWGRNGEAGAEDPYLMSQVALSLTQGMQTDPFRSKYTMASTTIKHFVANDIEDSDGYTRHTYDANISNYMTADTYFPAYRTAIREGGALGVMCAYNSVRGKPACLSPLLKSAREQWNFTGYVTSDSDAVADAYQTHHYVKTGEEATCGALTAGQCDMNSGQTYLRFLDSAVSQGICQRSDVERAVANTLRVRFDLGLFDDPSGQKLAQLGDDIIGSAEHQALSLSSARQSIVLLNNPNNILPFKLTKGTKIAVIGPHYNSTKTIMGTHYKGYTCVNDTDDCIVSIIRGVRALNADGETTGVAGSGVLVPLPWGEREAEAAAEAADIVILALGIDLMVEKEGTHGDRKSVDLPQVQHSLAKAVLAKGKPTAIVLINGGMLAMEAELQSAAGMLEAFYPGTYGGQAVAEAIFGVFSPSGKLPYTMYSADIVDQVSMLDMDLQTPPGRTYRYFTGRPLRPFGFGLSYTNFTASPSWEQNHTFALNAADPSSSVTLSVEYKNIGSMASELVSLAYFVPPATLSLKIRKQLVDFQRLEMIKPNSKATATFKISPQGLATVDPNGDLVILDGSYGIEVDVGDGGAPLTATVKVAGGPRTILPFPSV